MDYQEFLRQNRIRVNRSLNKAVFACLLGGIGIFIGTSLNLWTNIPSSSAITQMVLILMISVAMFIANKKYAHTYFPSIIGLLSLDLVLGYSANVHIGIYLTYFIVPLLAIAFCDKVFFLVMSGLNYVGMFLIVLSVSDYYASVRLDYYMLDNPGLSWFISHMVGYTIEYIVMTIAGWYICGHISDHLKALYDYQSRTVRQFKVMASATHIFEQIFYVSDTTQTYVVTHGQKFDFISKEEIENSLNALLQNVTLADKKRFKEFTDLNTVESRLVGKNIVEDTFYSTENGYFSAMFIAVSSNGNENADGYIFCSRDINDEKARERTLNEIARRDQPTNLLNRRAYEEDFVACEKGENENLSIIVVDINGLKNANDSLGHLAGDELILATSNFLNKYFENMGTVYRVGGDEFLVLIKDKQVSIIEDVIVALKVNIKNWKGKMGNTLSLSIGLASVSEVPEHDLKNLQKLADQRMYEDKGKYYAANPSLDRRTANAD